MPEINGGFAAQVPGASFATVANAAHLAMSDNPAAYLAILRPWLARNDAA